MSSSSLTTRIRLIACALQSASVRAGHSHRTSKIDGVASTPTLLDIRPLALKPLLTCGWLKHIAPLLAITLPAIASSRVWDLHQLRLSKPVHRDDLRAQSDAQDQGHEEPAPDQAAISLGRLSGGGCSSWKVTEAV